jgi:PBSX family phage terminase large subunit
MANEQNLQPFKKGDPRINRNGRPRTFDAARKLSQSKMNEPALDAKGEPIVKNGHIVTNAEMFFEAWMKSKDRKSFAEFTYGKVKEDEEQKPTIETKPLVIPADLIAPDFFASHRAVMSGLYDEFVEDGGRGSTKSSFISLEIIQLLVNDPEAHALATRQVKDTLRDSVFSQLVWAINVLGVSDKFNCTTSPLEITYLPTGQKIYFRGADDPMKIKSIKPTFGAIKILWFEELDSFHGAETVRNIEQSAIRGTDKAYIFKSFNPPRTAGNWANKYTLIPKPRQWHHKSNYLTVPPEWLGRVFIDEAEHLKNVNPATYEHEYLGIVNGDGGMVFDNVQLRPITDEEIAQFDNVLHGLDWGFYPDPASYGVMHYDTARRVLYIFGEVREFKKSNEQLYNVLVENGYKPNDLLIADSAEPKSVADMRAFGANCRGAEKGKESRKYSYKWLQGLTAIVIDPARAPAHADEFTSAEFERTKDGEIISEFPQVNDHSIDDTRYACNLIWRRRGE